MILLNDNNKNESIKKTFKNLYLKYKTPFILTGIKKNKNEIYDYLIMIIKFLNLNLL